MTEILTEPLEGKSVWTRRSLAIEDSIFRLSDTELAALEELASGTAPAGTAQSALKRVAAEIVAHCEERAGFAILRTLDANKHGELAAKTMFYKFCEIAGGIVTQNAKKETICEVTNVNIGSMEEGNVRGYLTNQELKFHTDSADI